MAGVLQVADRICLREGMGRRKPNPDLDPFGCTGAEALGLGDADLEDLLTRFHEGYEEQREIFS